MSDEDMDIVTQAVPPEYVAARAVLLDALAAVRAHLHAIVLVGAQAVYLLSAPGHDDHRSCVLRVAAPDALRDHGCRPDGHDDPVGRDPGRAVAGNLLTSAKELAGVGGRSGS